VLTKGLILAVDDSPDSLKLLTGILEDEGYEVRSAISGSLALRSAAIQRPDLVLLDAVMPGMDGYEFCRRFKLQADNRDVPVIFVSASADTGEKLQGFAVGAVDYVTKPFQREELLARVQIHLELYRLRHKLEDLVEERTRSLKLAATVFTHAREGIVITGADETIIDVNRTFSQITGYEREEAIGRPSQILRSGRHLPEFHAAVRKSLAEKGHWSGEIWYRRKNGEIYPAMLTISAVRDSDEVTRNYVAMFTDIKTIKEHQQQLEHVAYHDMLTNLPNRLLLADRLQQGIAQSQRRGQALAVVYLDLDGFKEINDHYGHNTGDELLVGLAAQMEAVLREGDTLARIGGDEFVAVLIDLNGPQDCVPFLKRLLKAASSPIAVNGVEVQLSASIGAALCPQDGIDADLLIRQADQAMYQAKQAGRNCYHLFDRDQNDAAKAQGETVKRLRHALKQREFVLHYQPKVNMRTGRVVGTEALIRWQHPEQGLLLPAAFLPMVEDHPVGIEIGEWVIDAALAQVADWRRGGLELPVSVNVSALQLQQGDFAVRLGERLQAHSDVPPSWLELEILETSALADIGNVTALMMACQEMGVRFALDDFGTGYSSLTYLRRLPAELLKIDQTFVRDMLKDSGDLAIVNGIVGLAKAFGRDVIAEGVETARHGRVLLSLGCDLAQGYGIAKPMPAEDLPRWIARWQRDQASHWIDEGADAEPTRS
jgi:diguanylate cyclase (GGDEF)-like protein/PAS domain S-box-containing protein